MNKFLKEFKDRGYFYQCTNEKELSYLLGKEKIKAYIGFDCTAESLHVGSLLQIMCLRLLQKHGHRPIVLLGGGTTRIGDPSGKEETRKILSEKQIESNINNIKKVFKIFLKTNEEKLKPIFVNNYKWLSKLNYINFLRDIGRHFTINKMLTFDSVKLRLEREQSLSYMEFNYMILQAYDFYELNKSNKCSLQIGGSDQWGNIVNGVELIKRESGNHVYGLTTPLITLASGAKMGKTEKGAIWLNKDMLSPYDYWQFWRNTDDRDVLKFLKMFTDLSLDGINNLKDKNINELNSPDSFGGFISWNTYKKNHLPSKYDDWYKGGVVSNPITWDKSIQGSKGSHLGVLGRDKKIYPNSLYTVEIDGILWSSLPKIKNRFLLSFIKDYHFADINLFWKDIEENAVLRVQSWLKEN